MKYPTLVTLALAVGLGASAASAAVIDFDGLDASAGQTVPLTSFTEDGYTFSLSTTGGTAGAAIFDTTCVGAACNGDTDLALSPGRQGENGVFGNVLIRQDGRRGQPVPNDSASPGSIILTLTAGPSFFLSGFSAIDDGTFKIFGGGAELGSIMLGENQTGKTTFGNFLVSVGDSLTLSYSGSGGFDSLEVAPVPLPAALPMLLAAMGGLGWVARRRRAA